MRQTCLHGFRGEISSLTGTADPPRGLLSFLSLWDTSLSFPPDSNNALVGPQSELDYARALYACLIFHSFSTGEGGGSAGPVTQVNSGYTAGLTLCYSSVISRACGFSCLNLGTSQCEVIQTIMAMVCIIHVGLKHDPEVPEMDLASEVLC